MGFGAATKRVDAMRLATNEMELPDSQRGPDVDLEADNSIFYRFTHDQGKIEFAMHSILHLECTKRSERLSLISRVPIATARARFVRAVPVRSRW